MSEILLKSYLNRSNARVFKDPSIENVILHLGACALYDLVSLLPNGPYDSPASPSKGDEDEDEEIVVGGSKR